MRNHGQYQDTIKFNSYILKILKVNYCQMDQIQQRIEVKDQTKRRLQWSRQEITNGQMKMVAAERRRKGLEFGVKCGGQALGCQGPPSLESHPTESSPLECGRTCDLVWTTSISRDGGMTLPRIRYFQVRPFQEDCELVSQAQSSCSDEKMVVMGKGEAS